MKFLPSRIVTDPGYAVSVDAAGGLPLDVQGNLGV